MARRTINGIGIDYDLLGDAGAPAVAITPGGRFARDTPGVPELAAELVKGGKRVLLWDRPNCGASDTCFDDSQPESIMHANVLGQLIRELDLGPTALAAGSAGSRTSLITASRHPDIISHLVVWWISGGNIGLMQLAWGYACEAANLASWRGMEAVADSPAWSDQVKRNPKTRDYILAQDPKRFIEIMQSWAGAYVPSKDSPVPGMSPENFAALTMPVLILRSSPDDVSHPRETTDWVHRLIPHSKMVDPPWRENEWNLTMVESQEGKIPGIFVSWPQAAPLILEFTAR
jgi:pimeloyl-ACP methyl ester carboxylesterase